jgi:uncharacterized protein YuzE
MVKLELNVSDVIKIKTETETLYLKVRCVSGTGNNMNEEIKGSYIELQATDSNGKVHTIDLWKVNKLPEGWKMEGWSRVDTEIESNPKKKWWRPFAA